MFEVDCHAVSDTGAGHHVSQDRFFITDVFPPGNDAAAANSRPDQPLHPRPARREPLPDKDHPLRQPHTAGLNKMFGVAHGVQGLPAGDRASEIVVETARNFVTRDLRDRVECRPDSLSCALTSVPGKCAKALSDDVARNPWERGLGSTLTLAYVVWPKLHLIHVGDCRCYLRRNSKIEQLTADQIVDGTLAERGIVTADSQPSLRRRTLWSFIGDNAKNLKPQLSEVELRVGDTLVLCTSGLVQEVPDDRIADILDRSPKAEDACRQLVEAAHDLGGTEDMTVIVVRFREEKEKTEKRPEEKSTSQTYWVDKGGAAKPFGSGRLRKERD